MKNSAKIGLTIALFSILGAGTLIKAVHATQIETLVEAVKPSSINAIAPNHPQDQETEPVKPSSINAIAPNHQQAQEKEDADDDNDGETNDDGQK